MSAIQSCAGGWCTKRDHCANYHAASPDQTPSERLCPPGQDGAGPTHHQETEMPKKMLLADRLNQAEALLNDDGVTLETIIAALGMCRTQCVRIVTKLCRESRAFRCRVKLDEESGNSSRFALFFKTAAARDAREHAYSVRMKERAREIQRFHGRAWKARNDARLRAEREANREQHAAYKRDYRARVAAEAAAAASAERLRLAKERADTKAIAAAEAEQRKQRERLDLEAAAAAKAREKSEAKKTQARLKAETKAAGQMAKLKAAKPAPVVVKARGPAFIAGELDLSRAKITIAPTPPDRWAATAAPAVVSSRECRKWTEAVAA